MNPDPATVSENLKSSGAEKPGLPRPVWTGAIVVLVAFRVGWSVAAAWMSPYLTLNPALRGANHLAVNLMDRAAGWPYHLLGVWERFDTLWYLHIAASGYDLPGSVVFYPLYPLLIHGTRLMVGNALFSALVVSFVSTGAMLIGLQRLWSLDEPRGTVRRALVLYAGWPTGFILFAGYAESTLLALMVWSLYSARRGRWVLAGGLGLLAGLSKATGAMLIIPLAVIAWRRSNWRAWPLGLAALGPLAFLGFLRSQGRLLPSEAYPLYWKTAVDWPWNTVADTVHRIVRDGDLGVGLNFALFLLTFSLALFRRQRPEYFAYTLALLLLFLTKRSDPVQQQWARYALLVFPACANAAAAIPDNAVLAAVLAALGAINLVLLRAFLEWSLVV